MNLLSGIFYSG